ncbi:MAG: Na+/H+ antiporter NhaA [Chitinophagaceae bacterium]|nr:Na+/H+ antiporter NhaA [Chitinophagaceae bacterium]
MEKISKLFKDFTDSEKSAGFVLILVTILSLMLANFTGDSYISFFQQKVGYDGNGIHLHLSVEHWINDGLMTIFFFMVGLEIEREIYVGELSALKSASLPIAGAMGGMLVPFGIFLVLNIGLETQGGFGIPMATDIAFALGILSLVKNIPHGLKVFLTAFAIIDDLGAIIIIGLFYSDGLNLVYLFCSLGMFIVLIVLNRCRVHSIWLYMVLGIIMWYCMLQSGVHATIAGILLAFALPFGKGDEHSPSYVMQRFLHKPVAFFILPVFAITNTAILIDGNFLEAITTNLSLGIILGLVIGKPLGIFLVCWLAIIIGWSRFPTGVNWSNLLGAAALGGIGFTMSIFITLLAFDNPVLVNQSKLAILVSSIVASLIGLIILNKPRK